VSQTRGRITTEGDSALAATLKEAWRSADGDGRELTHGFHPWPARLHPGIARVLIERLSETGDRVLDPFCGSGTVPIDAYACNRRAIGTDINPIAIAIARARSTLLDGEQRRRLEKLATEIANRAARRRPDPEDVPHEMRSHFDPRTWTELALMSEGVQRLKSHTERFLLGQVLSSILIRVSRQESETRSNPGSPPAPGSTTRRFTERTVELCKGIAALRRLARDNPRPLLQYGDARAIPIRSGVIDLIITSPPYLGTYDYGGIQTLRARLLGVDLQSVDDREMGTRARAKSSPAEETARFVQDLSRSLGEMRRVLRIGGLAAIVIGDSSIRESSVLADQLLHRATEGSGMRFLASAAQDRPITHRPSRAAYATRERKEHLIVFRAG